MQSYGTRFESESRLLLAAVRAAVRVHERDASGSSAFSVPLAAGGEERRLS